MKKLQAIITEMILKNQEQAEKQAFYENPHSPSSVNNIPTRQKKAGRTKENSSPKKAGAKIGRVGKSHKDTQTKKMCKMWQQRHYRYKNFNKDDN